jgi:hypothetical protein
MAAQLPDRIIMDGEFKNLYTNPLEQYWTNLGKRRPAFIPRYNCTRGYIATWAFRTDELYLMDIEGKYKRWSILFGNKPRPFTLRSFNRADRPTKAVWFSGKLRVPEGEMTMYDHHNYDSRFEKEVIITIERGNMIKMVTLDLVKKTLVLNSEILKDRQSED